MENDDTVVSNVHFIKACAQQAHSQGIRVGAIRPPRICKISKTKILIRSELCEDNITKPIHEERHSCDWQRVQAVNDKIHSRFTHKERTIILVTFRELK